MAFFRVLFLAVVASVASIAVAQYDLNDALSKAILFYEAQRSGPLPPDNRVPWRGNSALNDRGQNGEDLTGGYYDAGDFVKFNFPMAYSVSVLAWGGVTFADAYNRAGQAEYLRSALRWGTDYFLKCHVSPNELYGQVGDGNADHAFWGRPEEMNMERPAWKIDSGAPGSDLAGETAAALAATSIVVRNGGDGGYADTLVQHARDIFTLAINSRGYYSQSISNAAAFYSSSRYDDELVWAAAWLHKATGEQSYLDEAIKLFDEFGLGYSPSEFSWNDKTVGAQVLLAEATNDQRFKGFVQGFCDNMRNNQQKTPKGLVFISEWGSLRHASNVAFICLQAAQLGISTPENIDFARKQINYILGDTGRSFVVGYGVNPPTQPHHRSSSCPNQPEACDWEDFDNPGPNPQVLVGALVGGPDANDVYTDVRSDYRGNEVACDYNAGFAGALAGIIQLG